jgi:EAL domain-containing protein (putative c-di-GMP-specific phosphodiesterase class I)
VLFRSEEQLTLLAREGCDIYQGFLRSRPVTSAELVEMVERAV